MSKTFQAATKASKQIQRKMFLLDDPSARISDPIEELVNPLLLDKTLGFGNLNFWIFHNGEYPACLDLQIVTRDFMDLKHGFAHGSWRQTRLAKRTYDVHNATLITDAIEEDAMCLGDFRLQYDVTLEKLTERITWMADHCGLVEDCTIDDEEESLRDNGWELPGEKSSGGENPGV